MFILFQVKGVFEFHVKNEYNGETQVFTIDLKDKGSVYSGESGGHADTVFYIADNDFISIAKGKMTSKYRRHTNPLGWFLFNMSGVGQRAYTLSKLKIKGQIKLATRLDTVLKQLRGKSRL